MKTDKNISKKRVKLLSLEYLLRHPIRIISIALIVVAISFSDATEKSVFDLNLYELTSIAHAEEEGKEEESSGWLWQSREESCTYTITITIGGGPVPGSVQRTDTYSGKRTVCDDGSSLCFSCMCG